MTRFSALIAAAGLAAALGACASQPPVADDWTRPMKEPTGKVVFQHDMAIANAPHPQPHYANPEDEPSRFTFRPRNVPVDNGDNGEGDQGVDEGGEPTLPYVQNGIMYVDPNQ